MMKRDDFQRAVDELKSRVPFRPFVIEMDSGQRFVVADPKALSCYAGGGTYSHADGNFDFVESEDVSRLVEVEEKKVSA